MRARQTTVRVFTLFLVLSAAYLAVWHLMNPLTRTEMTYAVLYTYLARPLFWFCVGGIGVWTLKRAFPALNRPLSHPVRTLLTVLTILCIAFYLVSLCLPPLFLVWVYIPWVFILPGAMALHLLTAD